MIDDAPDTPAPLDVTATAVVEPENALPSVSLSELPTSLQAAAARAGWQKLMPVQAKALPYIFAGRDLLVQSRTGSGKTGAFILPMLERLNPLRAETQALILAPTRELAQQVAAEATMLAGDAGLRIAAVYGGVSYKPQLQAFKEGAHIVVGTPGRILDHLIKKNLSLSGLEMLVFDEADRLLSMGFFPDMLQIKGFLSDRSRTGTMFSATFPPHVMRLARHFLDEPSFLSLSRDNVHVMETDHVYYLVDPMDKDRTLVRIIEQENPASAIIFCNTKNKVNYVNIVLQRFGYDADDLSSDLSQQARDKVLNRVREGKLRFLVATDVAARGIDIPDLSHVIQYEPPEDDEIYIHRAGRTGRAGASGIAITLVDFMESVKLKRIAKRYGIELEERPSPDDEDVAALVSQRVTAMLEAQLRVRDRLQQERMQRFLPLARELGESEAALTLMAMLLDDYYQKTLHGLPTPQEAPDAPRRDNADKGRSGRNRRRGSGQRRN